MKSRQKKDYVLFKFVEAKNGDLVSLPTLRGESDVKRFLRFYFNGVSHLTEYYQKLMVELKLELKTTKITWEEVGDHLCMSRATIYRKVKDGKLNPFEIQAIWDLIKSRQPKGVKLPINNLEMLNEALIVLKDTIYGKAHITGKIKLKRKA